jgi:hypothetical protein
MIPRHRGPANGLQSTTPGGCRYGTGRFKKRGFFNTHAKVSRYQPNFASLGCSPAFFACFRNSSAVNGHTQSTKSQIPMTVPEPLGTRPIVSRSDVLDPRISHDFFPALLGFL